MTILTWLTRTSCYTLPARRRSEGVSTDLKGSKREKADRNPLASWITEDRSVFHLVRPVPSTVAR